MKFKNLIKQNKFILLLLLILILFLILILYFDNYRDFSKVTLSKNKKEIFNISDLKVDNVKYLSTYDDVIITYAKPLKEEELVENGYNYKILTYNGLKLTLKEYYNDYVLIKAEITSKNYKTSRNIKVGNKVRKVFRKYYVKNKKSYYMYGNYTNKSLKDDSIIENIYFGHRGKNEITYVNRDYLTSDDNYISKVVYEYKNGKITKITWSYDLF